MFEATYYQLLLLYYNVVVSVLVADQCSFSHKHMYIEAYCSCNSTLHATYIYILHVQTKQSQAIPFLTAGQIIL